MPLTQVAHETLVALPPITSVGEDTLIARAAAVAEQCAALAPASDHEGAFPVAEFQLLAAAGLLAAPLAPALGGQGLGSTPGSVGRMLQVLKQIGRGSLPVGRLYEGHVNGLLLVQLYGSPTQQAVYAADVRDHDRIFGVWNTDGPGGVRITPVGNGRFRLDGAKIFCSGAGHVLRPFVNGALPDGAWQMCVVPMERVHTPIDPAWWQAEGMRASASYAVDFTGVELGSDALIGAPGDYAREPHFNGGAVRFAAVQLGGAEALFDATRRYLQALDRTGDPFQQARLGEMAIAVRSGDLWLQAAAAVAERSDLPTATVVAHANMVRTAIASICEQVLSLADRCVGARGLLRPHPVERIGRDLRLYLRQPAPDAVLANVGRFALERRTPAWGLWETAEAEEKIEP
jgi:alkylation response protein AidB-like acyl-CoA dehydrogenase